MHNFLKNISYTIFSNGLSLLISGIILLIVPKFLSIENYGYLQLYIFYVSYVGFMHFGWNDGIYLRYGGAEFEKLDKNLFFSQFYSLLIFQTILAIIFYFLSLIYILDIKKIFVIHIVIMAMVVENTKTMLLFVMQITGRIKEYAQTIIIVRLTYFAQVILLLLAFSIRDYKAIILADLISRFIGLVFISYKARSIVLGRLASFRVDWIEIRENVCVGIKLSSANIVGMLIIGIARFAIERTWGVAAFGQVSLAISLSNVAMIFINAISIVLYPTLCRWGHNRLKQEFKYFNVSLNIILLGILVFYYPLIYLLRKWLGQYTLSLNYIGILFPIVFFECKNSLLLSTYMKSLRLESTILKINLLATLISLIFTYVFTHIYINLTGIILLIVSVLMLRCLLNEIYLINLFEIKQFMPSMLSYTLPPLFILLNIRCNNPLTSMLLYTLIYLFYIGFTYNITKDLISKVLIRQ